MKRLFIISLVVNHMFFASLAYYIGIIIAIRSIHLTRCSSACDVK